MTITAWPDVDDVGLDERAAEPITPTIAPPPVRRRRRLREGWIVALFTGLAVLMTCPDPSKLATEVPGDGGDALFIVWTMRWIVHSAGSGWDALWSPGVMWPGSNALAFSDTLLPIAPIFVALERLTGSAALAFNLVSVTAWTGGLWCTYRLARRLTASVPASVFAAIAFTFSTPHLAQYRHLQLVIGGLLPGIILLALRFAERPRARRGALLAAAIAALTLTASYYGLAAMIVTAIVIVVARRGTEWRRLAIGLGTAAVVGAALLGPFAVRYQQVTTDPAMRREPLRMFDAAPSDLLAVSVDNQYVRQLWPVAHQHEHKTSENWLFPGFILSATAVVGVVGFARARRRDAVAVVVAAAVLGVLALGDVATIAGHDVRLPFSFLRAHVPGFAGVRVPARFMLIGVLGVAVLGAFGVRLVLRKISRAGGLVLVAALSTLVLVETATAIETVPLTPTPAGGAVNEALAERAPGVVAELPMRSSIDGAAWPFVEMSRQLLATIDWHPRINGYSGFEVRGQTELAAAVNTFPSMQAIAALDEHEVRYVVLRTALPIDLGRIRNRTYSVPGVGVLDDETVRTMIAGIPPDRLVSVEHHGDAYLIELSPPAPRW